MASNLMSDGFAERFCKHVAMSTDIWIASAWLTQSEALDDLAHNGRGLRALAGVHGNATDPASLEKILDTFGCSSLRIVEGGPLFHPKVYLFRHDSGKDTAWIGSANFTGPGFNDNREILLETDEVSVVNQIQLWFETEWRKLEDQDVKVVLSDYRARRRREGIGSLTSIVEPPETGESPQVTRIEFQPSDKRMPPPYTGKVRITSVVGVEEKRYSTTTQGLQVVLDRIQRTDEGFLDECAKHPAFQQRHRNNKNPSMWLSQERERIKEVRAAAGELGADPKTYKKGISPAQLDCGWWLSRDRDATQVWKLIRTAVVEIARIELVPESVKCGL